MFSLLTPLVLAQALHTPFPVPDGDFEQGGRLWENLHGSPVAFEAHPGPTGNGANTVAVFAPSPAPGTGYHELRLTLATGANTPFFLPATAEHLGRKLEFCLWFQVDAGARSGDLLRLRLCTEGTLLAEAAVDPSEPPPGRWHALTLDYDAARGLHGCLLAGTATIELTLEVDSAAELRIDDLHGRPYDTLRYPLENADFEAPRLEAWHPSGDVQLDAASPAYYGRRSVFLGPEEASLVQHTPAQSFGLEPQSGDRPEAGLWVRLEEAIFPGPAAEIVVSVAHRVDHRRVHVQDPLPRRTLVAETRLPLEELEPGVWRYLETQSLEPLPHLDPDMRRARLELRIEKRGFGVVQVDFPQLGDAHSVDGNDKRFVYANYVARFRNPDFAPDPVVDAPTNELGKRWRNWYWGNPPACDPGTFTFEHDPRNLRPGNAPHEAGRRDLAISAWDLRPLPLLGAYDSRDPLIVDFHARLAHAAGLDALMFGWYGQKAVELDQCAPRNVSVNGPALEELYRAIEAQGSDLKVATKMNLLRHANNAWANPPAGCDFESEDTLLLKREGIRDDLVWLVETYFTHRATLKRENRMVIGVFDPERTFSVSNGPATQLSQDDWLWIKDGVESTSGRAIELIFDQAPLLSTSLTTAAEWFADIATGSALWRLAPCEVCQFIDFDAFEAGVANTIDPEDLRTHFRDQVLGRPYRWWRMDDTRRLGVAVVYPGYDDSGVSGWGNPNGTCTGGGTRCTRVVSPTGICQELGERCFLDIGFQEAELSGMSWIQIPTWNDWNEMTVLEPRYSATYVDAALRNLSQAPADSAHDREWVLGRLLAAQAGIAAFKRTIPDPGALDAIVRGILLALGGTPYD